MSESTKVFDRSVLQLCAAALSVGIVAISVPPTDADAADARWGNPCDTRDTCSADPAKYAAFRDNGPVKAREYVGEMRWGTGGAPDDVYVITRTVGSREFAGAKPCDVRDVCSNGQETYKVVRSGPSDSVIATAARAGGVQVANQPAHK